MGDPYQQSINLELQQLQSLATVYSREAESYAPLNDHDFRPGITDSLFAKSDGSFSLRGSSGNLVASE